MAVKRVIFMKITSLFFALSLFLSFQLHARDVLRDCDTLVTQSGQMLLVQIEQMTDSTITFRYCGSAADVPSETRPSDFVRQIRKAIPSNGKKTIHVDMSAPMSTVEVPPTPAEIKKVNLNTKMALFFALGSLFLWFFSALFSPYIGILILPFLIAGIVFSSRTLKATRKKPLLVKQRASGLFSMIICSIQLGFALLYILALLIFFALVF